MTKDIANLCSVGTLNEQREIWDRRLRRVMLSRFLAYTVIGSERFLWKALGVPKAQREMIQSDYRMSTTLSSREDATASHPAATMTSAGQAIWEYGVNTLDPVVHNTLVGEDNHYYLVCLQGKYTEKCHPTYCSPRSHARLSAPHAFDGLRIHTDELAEVLARMAPDTLTIAVLMDSMDWFDPSGAEHIDQIAKISRALKVGGRVLIRSAGLRPWYITSFEEGGFVCKRVGARTPAGACIDRSVFFFLPLLLPSLHFSSSRLLFFPSLMGSLEL